MKKLWILLTCLFAIILVVGCNKKSSMPGDAALYFPPIGASSWETTSPESLGWKNSALPQLYSFLESTNTRAFIVLKNGRIVLEKYFGKQANGTDFNASSFWYWASAGKTLTVSLVGIAQQEGLLQIDRPSSNYIGAGWTSLTAQQELQITVRHQLTMTTGLDDGVADPDCTMPACLKFKAAPGTMWAYHNAAYTMLDQVVAGAAKQSFQSYFNARLRDKIGMDGAWLKVEYNNVYYSTARSMARYGLLILNGGKWANDSVINDNNYMQAMIKTSQGLNQSYGYLWWLNGKSSFMAPGAQLVFPGSVSPNAPAEMFAAMGKNAQYINIVPSQKLVVIRMGDNPDNSLVPFTYQNLLWEQLNKVIR